MPYVYRSIIQILYTHFFRFLIHITCPQTRWFCTYLYFLLEKIYSLPLLWRWHVLVSRFYCAGFPSTMNDWRLWHWSAKSDGKLVSWLYDTSIIRRLPHLLNIAGNVTSWLYDILIFSSCRIQLIEAGSSDNRLFDIFRDLFLFRRWPSPRSLS